MLSQEENDLLTQVGPGTPGGEMLRRYWQPVALAEELPPGGPPLPVRLLGEDLVLFRESCADGELGRPGLLGLHCTHRGADLSYGRIEDGGLRCLYHGWLYDVQGRCLEQPGEPAGSTFCEKIHHLAYPCQEKAEVIFAYLGPGEPPLLPAYGALLAPPDHRWVTKYFCESSYLQANEGNADAAHVPVLHGFRANSDLAAKHPKEIGAAHSSSYVRPHNRLLELDAEETDFGVRIYHTETASEGETSARVMNMVLPNLCAVPGGPSAPGDGYLIYWHVPIDDTHHWRYAIAFKRSAPLDKELGKRRKSVMGPDYHLIRNQSNRYLQDREEMRTRTLAGLGEIFIVGDNWASETPGPIQDRTQEHLGAIDKGVILLRRMMLQAIKQVQAGQDPPHVLRSPEENVFDHITVGWEPIPAGSTLAQFRKRKKLPLGRVAASV